MNDNDDRQLLTHLFFASSIEQDARSFVASAPDTPALQRHLGTIERYHKYCQALRTVRFMNHVLSLPVDQRPILDKSLDQEHCVAVATKEAYEDAAAVFMATREDN